jgi:uncharacterized protein YuzE
VTYHDDVRVTYDAKVDMAYIYLREIEAGGVATTVPGWPDSEAFGINLDFAADGTLVGIEVSGASGRLPPDILAAAQRH